MGLGGFRLVSYEFRVVSGGFRVGIGFAEGLFEVDSMWFRDGLALAQGGFGGFRGLGFV